MAYTTPCSQCSSPPAAAPVGARPGLGSLAAVSPEKSLSFGGLLTSAPCPPPLQQPDGKTNFFLNSTNPDRTTLLDIWMAKL